MIHLGADGTSSSSFALCFPFGRETGLRHWILGGCEMEWEGSSNDRWGSDCVAVCKSGVLRDGHCK